MRSRAFGSLIVAVIAGCCLARAGHAFVGQQAPAIDSAKREKLSEPARLAVTVSDGRGGFSTRTINVTVPHSRNGDAAIDSGLIVNSK